MDLVVTPAGTARPEEILVLLGLEKLLENGAVFERTRLELDDEPAADEIQRVAGSLAQINLDG
jgi:hypothetical protein